MRLYCLPTLLHFPGLKLSFLFSISSGTSWFLKLKCVEIEEKVRNRKIKVIDITLFSGKLHNYLFNFSVWLLHPPNQSHLFLFNFN